MESSGRQKLEIKLEPLEAEPDWPGIAVELDLVPEMLGSVPVKPEPGAAVKTEAGWLGDPEMAARAGAGPSRWLSAVRIPAADRAATEAQLPALAPVKEEAFEDPVLDTADLSDSSGDSVERPGPPSAAEEDLQEQAVAHHQGSTTRSCVDCDKTIRRSRAQSSQCGREFKRLSHLKAHKQVHSDARPFVCPECGVAFKGKEGLQKHSRTHTGEKPHVCTQCGRGFANLWSLRVHNRIHTGARPHACPDCGRAFAELSSLRAHKRAHTGARPYTCPDCDQRFSEAGHLRIHQQAVHLKLRPHVCPDCDQRFSQASHLRTHQQAVHLKLRPHACPDCGRRFAHTR